MFSFVFEVRPLSDGWSVALRDEPGVLKFATGGQAERRARALAARQAVRGHRTEIWLYDLTGNLVGRWLDERFVYAEPALDNAA